MATRESPGTVEQRVWSQLERHAVHAFDRASACRRAPHLMLNPTDVKVVAISDRRDSGTQVDRQLADSDGRLTRRVAP
jgi:hypothetical protein